MCVLVLGITPYAQAPPATVADKIYIGFLDDARGNEGWGRMSLVSGSSGQLSTLVQTILTRPELFSCRSTIRDIRWPRVNKGPASTRGGFKTLRQ